MYPQTIPTGIAYVAGVRSCNVAIYKYLLQKLQDCLSFNSPQTESIYIRQFSHN